MLQSAVDSVPQRKRHNSRSELSRHATRERAHSECSGYGFARRARTGYRLGLCRGCCCSIKQDSGQQGRTAGSVSEPQGSLLGLEFSRRQCRGGQYPSPVGSSGQSGISPACLTGLTSELLTARPVSADCRAPRQHDAHTAQASKQTESERKTFEAGVNSCRSASPPRWTTSLIDWRSEFSEQMSGRLHDGECPNPSKASQNRAMRGIRHPGVLE